MHTVQEPGYRTHCPKFTKASAEAFLASWCRIVESDGSTVGYAPDLITARLHAKAPEMAALVRMLSQGRLASEIDPSLTPLSKTRLSEDTVLTASQILDLLILNARALVREIEEG